jgi:acylphosphatase
MERRRVRFTGRVQGVGFRATARGIADGYSVTGWVRNEDDGSVVLEIQGAREEIDRCLGALRGKMGRYISSEDGDLMPIRESEDAFRINR